MNPVYQCAKCKERGNEVKGQKMKITCHILRDHRSLDNVPFYCKLCMFRCLRRKELDIHLTTYERHKLMAKGQNPKDLDPSTMLVENQDAQPISQSECLKLAGKPKDILALATQGLFNDEPASCGSSTVSLPIEHTGVNTAARPSVATLPGTAEEETQLPLGATPQQMMAAMSWIFGMWAELPCFGMGVTAAAASPRTIPTQEQLAPETQGIQEPEEVLPQLVSTPTIEECRALSTPPPLPHTGSAYPPIRAQTRSTSSTSSNSSSDSSDASSVDSSSIRVGQSAVGTEQLKVLTEAIRKQGQAIEDQSKVLKMVLQWVQFFDLQYLRPKLVSDQAVPPQHVMVTAATQTSTSTAHGTADGSPKRQVKTSNRENFRPRSRPNRGRTGHKWARNHPYSNPYGPHW